MSLCRAVPRSGPLVARQDAGRQGPRGSPGQGGGCTPPLRSDDAEKQRQQRIRSIAVTPRGGCSFGAKALAAQARGYSGLVILDGTSAGEGEDGIMPPGLGDESLAVTIPVVMAAAEACTDSARARQQRGRERRERQKR